MKNLKKYAFMSVMLLAAGFAYYKGTHGSVSSDLRDAPRDYGQGAAWWSDHNDEAVPVPEPKAAQADADAAAKPVEWVAIPGGKFMMGTDDPGVYLEDARPVHEVEVASFEMSKTAVTVGQYAQCVAKGKCTKPNAADNCNWGKPRRLLHPVNCVDWRQANEYAKFMNARLPTEAEWEYAAKSGGKDQKYPWGGETPTCDRVVMGGNGGFGCGEDSTWPVCSKPDGNTEQGLCDMIGNVSQWVSDAYRYDKQGQGSYSSKGAVADDSLKVVRGGSFQNFNAACLRADSRDRSIIGSLHDNIGFRLVR
ncbi:MAG: SUMF1/EgtB/PvdO family nonheme iron enzyme [Elusimicrobiales bacterium]|jgi:iron(II)-dependent oxidoreductase